MLYICENKIIEAMSTFDSSKRYEVSFSFIPSAVNAIKTVFEAEGFEFEKKTGTLSKTVVEVTKGDLVRQAIGLKQGLQITLEHDGQYVNVEAKGIVVKNQLIASAIALFVTWPVLIPQIIGLINQSKLDEKAIAVIDSAFASYNTDNGEFCTCCGARVSNGETHCPHCGAAL